MKKRTFTLVELLVVIGIIAILAGILLPTVSGASQKADQTKAKAQITTLVNAIKQFEATYGYLPTKYYNSSGTLKSLFYKTDAPGDDSEEPDYNEMIDPDKYEKLIRILQNEEETTKKINVKKIKFLDIVGNTPGAYQDPWENDYIIYLDKESDGKIFPFHEKSGKHRSNGTFSYFTKDHDAASKDPMYYDVIIFSRGVKDKDDSIKSIKDNVYSFPVQWIVQDKDKYARFMVKK